MRNEVEETIPLKNSSCKYLVFLLNLLNEQHNTHQFTETWEHPSLEKVRKKQNSCTSLPFAEEYKAFRFLATNEAY